MLDVLVSDLNVVSPAVMQWDTVGRLSAGCRGMMGLDRVLLLILFSSSGWTLTYKQGENVTLYVNKVGPYHNPQETYHYYTLPVCSPQKVRLCSVWLRLCPN